MELIPADLTEIFKDYSTWDLVVRRKYLEYASNLIQQRQPVFYKGIAYHNIEDLKVDLDAECRE